MTIKYIFYWNKRKKIKHLPKIIKKKCKYEGVLNCILKIIHKNCKFNIFWKKIVVNAKKIKEFFNRKKIWKNNSNKIKEKII